MLFSLYSHGLCLFLTPPVNSSPNNRAVIGAVATAVGVVLGIAVALNAERFRAWFEATTGQQLLGGNLYFLSSLPAKVDWMEVGMVVLMALVLSFLATLYPARRAAALDPAEALRYE